MIEEKNQVVAAYRAINKGESANIVIESNDVVPKNYDRKKYSKQALYRSGPIGIEGNRISVAICNCKKMLRAFGKKAANSKTEKKIGMYQKKLDNLYAKREELNQKRQSLKDLRNKRLNKEI